MHLDIELTDEILKLIDLKEININEIEEFIKKRNSELLSALQPKNGLIFQQPISLLVSYYFFEYKDFLRDNWPLNEESLKTVYKAFNTSFNKY